MGVRPPPGCGVPHGHLPDIRTVQPLVRAQRDGALQPHHVRDRGARGARRRAGGGALRELHRRARQPRDEESSAEEELWVRVSLPCVC